MGTRLKGDRGSWNLFAPNSKYNWNKWFGPPGRVRTDHYWRLRRGEHFSSQVSSFRQTCHVTARSFGVVIRTSTDARDPDLVILHVIGPRRES